MENDRREKVLEVAGGLFLHHGFPKVTLSDIAKEVGVSRPTLYQVFPNKEEIFKAIMVEWQEGALSRIGEKRNPDSPVEVQLRKAIDIWVIEPYEMIQASPRAADFQDATFDFAEEVIDRGYASFEAVIRVILGKGKSAAKVAIKDVAHLMVISLRGCKSQAKDVKELKKLVRSLVALVVAK